MKFSLRNILFIFVTGSLVATSIFLTEEKYHISNSEIPLIRPDEGDIKIKPIEPGGVEFPNMDKSVYEHISPSKVLAPNEKLMPGPEQALLSVKQLNTESVFSTSEFSTQENDELSIFNENDYSVNEESVNDINVITIDQTDERLVIDRSEGRKSALKYKVQISATKTEKQALDNWNKALKNNKELLSKYKYNISKVDLSEKGVIYKLYIGPLNNYNEANSLCKKLIKRKQSCIVVNE